MALPCVERPRRQPPFRRPGQVRSPAVGAGHLDHPAEPVPGVAGAPGVRPCHRNGQARGVADDPGHRANGVGDASQMAVAVVAEQRDAPVGSGQPGPVAARVVLVSRLPPPGSVRRTGRPRSS